MNSFSRRSAKSHEQPARSQKSPLQRSPSASARVFQVSRPESSTAALLNKRVSKPQDNHERNASSIAARIMMASPAAGANSSATDRSIQRQPLNKQTAGQPSAGLFSGAGRPLPEHSRRFFESHFNQDLRHIRIHDDNNAQATARGMNARAFTQYNHIGFDRNQFNPDTVQGKRLLAHELAHAIDASAGANSGDIYRETWDIDDHGRTVKRGILVQLIFNDTYVDHLLRTGWTTTRKNTFRSEFKSSIESSFNNNSVVLNPPASAADVLPSEVISKGYKPSVEISLVPDGQFSIAEDWEVDVSSNPTHTFRTSSSNRRYGTLDEADNQEIAKESSAPGVKQVPTVHEFGHFTGWIIRATVSTVTN